MAKTKALMRKTPDRSERLASEFFTAQGEAEERALPNFQAALKRAAETALREALAEVASTAFGDGVEWANNTPRTKAERKAIA